VYNVTKDTNDHGAGGTPRLGFLHGPPDGLRAWTDWIIDARKRWHEGDPPRAPISRWQLALGSGGALALAALIQHLIGG
jgi:hypothetical protein